MWKVSKLEILPWVVLYKFLRDARSGRITTAMRECRCRAPIASKEGVIHLETSQGRGGRTVTGYVESNNVIIYLNIIIWLYTCMFLYMIILDYTCIYMCNVIDDPNLHHVSMCAVSSCFFCTQGSATSPEGLDWSSPTRVEKMIRSDDSPHLIIEVKTYEEIVRWYSNLLIWVYVTLSKSTASPPMWILNGPWKDAFSKGCS